MIINAHSAYGFKPHHHVPARRGLSQLEDNGTQLEQLNPEDHQAPLSGPSSLEHNSTQFLSQPGTLSRDLSHLEGNNSSQ